METYTFTIIARATDDQANDDAAQAIHVALYGLGADDALPTVSRDWRTWELHFDREAPSYEDAVLTAITDTTAAGLDVMRVDPEMLVAAADIAERTGRSRQYISQLIAGQRGPGGWPQPMAGNVRSPLWRWSDVAAWFQAFDGSQDADPGRAAFLIAVNEALATRRALRQLVPPTRERVAGLVG